MVEKNFDRKEEAKEVEGLCNDYQKEHKCLMRELMEKQYVVGKKKAKEAEILTTRFT